MKYDINPSMKIFIDSSVIIAGLLSDSGGSAKIMGFCESKLLEGHISSQVVEEISSVIKRKIPEISEDFNALVRFSNLKILKMVPKEIQSKAKTWITDPNDSHILAAAKHLQVDYLLTLDIHHFIKDKSVAKKSQLKILTPKEFLQTFAE